MKRKNKIGIDCRLSGSRHAGIGRYIENMVIHLVFLEFDWQWVLFFYDKNQANIFWQKLIFFGSAKENFKKIISKIKIVYLPIKHYSLREQLVLPKIFTQEKLDILHVPHFNAPIFYSGKLVVTIHDLLWHEMRGAQVTTLPIWQYYLKYWFYLLVVKRVVKKSQAIIVPALTTKKTILKFYPQAEKKIHLIKEGVFVVRKKNLQKEDLNLPQKYLLYVGSLYPHKNLNFILEILSSIEYQLVVVTTRNAFLTQFKEKIKQMNLNKKIMILEKITDQNLIVCYQRAQALIQPSLSEGFGLTTIEAMYYKTLILASNIKVFKEICGPIPFYFNPKDKTSFLFALKQLENANRSNKIAQGLEWVKQYDFVKMGQQILNLYHQIFHE